MTERLDALFRPVDIASAALFRILFGLTLFAGALRFTAQGWVDLLFVQPEHFFTYPGFSWVRPLSGAGMTLLYGVIAVAALCIALGFLYRAAVITFIIAFAWAQLVDVTNYLNHYYLVLLLALWMAVLPLNGAWSVDAGRNPRLRRDTMPAWGLYALRFQVGVVYVFAGLAKLGRDWLLHGQPMNIWMSARTETPLIGPWLDEPAVALAMSWAGFLFDLTIVLWLLLPQTRRAAYLVLLLFHGLTGLLFDIGMFPLIMPVATLLFFDSAGPRNLAAALRRRLPRRHAPPVRAAPPARPPPLPSPSRRRLIAAALAVIVLLQIAVPLRHYATPGNVLWNEQGMRFAWKVMVREKNGSITYHVRDPASDRRWEVSPDRYLDRRQTSEMSGQPDLILALAHHIARDFEARGLPGVEVRAETAISLNGRPPAPLLDPDVDLTGVSRWTPAHRWILPEPESPPIRLSPRANR